MAQFHQFNNVEEAEELLRNGHYLSSSNESVTRSIIDHFAYGKYLEENFESKIKPLTNEKDYFIPQRESNSRLEPIDPTYKPERGQVIETKIEKIINETPKRKWWQIWK